MATVEDVATLALSAVDVSAERPIGTPVVALWVMQRYRELTNRTRFRHLRRVGVLNIPAAINTGTVTATLGSTAVTADAAAQAAITAAGGASAITDRFIRLSSNAVWYEIESYSAPTITLATPFTQDDITDSGFLILPRFQVLNSAARWLGTFVFPRRRRVLGMRSYMDYDRTAPERMLTSDGPWFVAEATNQPADTLNLGTAGAKRVELYPYSLTEETVYYVFWAIPDALALTDTLPQEIDPYVLREGVLIDIFRYRASQAANAGRIEEAGYWRNESRAQSTSWEDQIREAAKADRGMDDVSFILHTSGLGTTWGRDIVNARDFVWAQGNRP